MYDVCMHRNHLRYNGSKMLLNFFSDAWRKDRLFGAGWAPWNRGGGKGSGDRAQVRDGGAQKDGAKSRSKTHFRQHPHMPVWEIYPYEVPTNLGYVRSIQYFGKIH